MISSILYGTTTSLTWGSADFIARFTGRALGHQSALFGMLLISAIGLTLLVWWVDLPIIYDYSGWWLLLAAGVSFMITTLLLYWALTRGPVTVVAPIAGAYPVFNLIFAVITGVIPSALQWGAMGLVMSGAAIVAVLARDPEDTTPRRRKRMNKTIYIALGASFGFALTTVTGQAAIPIYGELQTVWVMRWISVIAIMLFFVGKREAPEMPIRWWPILGIQGALDSCAYLALLLGSQGIGAQITVVVGSTFSAVTVVLARIILRESMTWIQWTGVGLIIVGIAVLSAE